MTHGYHSKAKEKLGEGEIGRAQANEWLYVGRVVGSAGDSGHVGGSGWATGAESAGRCEIEICSDPDTRF